MKRSIYRISDGTILRVVTRGGLRPRERILGDVAPREALSDDAPLRGISIRDQIIDEGIHRLRGISERDAIELEIQAGRDIVEAKDRENAIAKISEIQRLGVSVVQARAMVILWRGQSL